jgi:hypothetical protein
MYICAIIGRHFFSPHAFANTVLLLPVMCNQNAGPKNRNFASGECIDEETDGVTDCIRAHT